MPPTTSAAFVIPAHGFVAPAARQHSSFPPTWFVVPGLAVVDADPQAITSGTRRRLARSRADAGRDCDGLAVRSGDDLVAVALHHRRHGVVDATE
jgi:hypothetical protein